MLVPTELLVLHVDCRCQRRAHNGVLVWLMDLTSVIFRLHVFDVPGNEGSIEAILQASKETDR